jgi:ADP-heptose:LPS heptosyltransferase
VEPQFLINILFAVAGAAFGWILNSLTRQIVRIEDKISEIPVMYVSKDDYRSDIAEIKNMLGKIFDRLDQKADR